MRDFFSGNGSRIALAYIISAIGVMIFMNVTGLRETIQPQWASDGLTGVMSGIIAVFILSVLKK